MIRISSALLCLWLIANLGAQESFAGGKKRKPPEVIDGKRALVLSPTADVSIELPDQSKYALGIDFDAQLITFLQKSGRYTVVSSPSGLGALTLSEPSKPVPPDFQWPGGVVPAATIKITIDGMTFQTGSRGSRMVYGFNDRLPNVPNEFPLRDKGFSASWFGSHFEPKGKSPWHSTSGLELGEGFSLDALFAYLTVKYERYRAQLGLTVEITSALTGHTHTQVLDVRGKGYFLDVAGAYAGYSVGLRIARKDAMLKATQRALYAAFQSIDQSLRKMPIVGQVDQKLMENAQPWILLGFGPEPAIQVGTKFQNVGEGPAFELEVRRSNASGAIAQVTRGDWSKIAPGTLVKQVLLADPGSSTLSLLVADGQTQSTQNTVQATDATLSPPSFPPGALPRQSRWTAFRKAIFELIFLPYRIWRYYQYDQAFDDGRTEQLLAEAPAASEPPLEAQDTAQESKDESTSTDAMVSLTDQSVVTPIAIAVIDTGVDLTHRALRHTVWRNPVIWPDRSGQTDPWGFDFISGDPRPYDDHFHGTQVASAIVQANPNVKIIPLKIFNPWGVTQSGAILGAFEFARKHHIKVIVCAWDTLQKTDTMDQAVEIARSYGAVVFAAAGDRGLSIDQFPAYPAAYARNQDHVVAVTAVDADDRLYKETNRGANFGPQTVGLAVRAVGLSLAEPRGGKVRVTSTGVAAGRAAGDFTRWFQAERRTLGRGRGLAADLQDYLSDQEQMPELIDRVAEGRRLR